MVRRDTVEAALVFERTSKDNGPAIYWATVKLYAGARPRFTISYVRHAYTHTYTHTHTHTHTSPFRALTISSWLITRIISVIKVPSNGARTSNKVTINCNNECRGASKTRWSFLRRTRRTNANDRWDAPSSLYAWYEIQIFPHEWKADIVVAI